MPPELTPAQAAHVDRLYRYLCIQRPAPDAILRRFREVPRHWFVETLHLYDRDGGVYDHRLTQVEPDCADGYILERIYVDSALCVQMKHGICTSSTSQPSLMAQMMAQVGVRPGARVLEIGSATGWNAALMSGVTGPTGRVTTVEVDTELAEQARRHLAAAGCSEAVRVVCADGYLGEPGEAPYDSILVTVACPEVPRSWLEQLASAGRLLVPLALPGGAAPLLSLQRQRERWRGRFTGWAWFVEARGGSWECWPPALVPSELPWLRALLDQPAQHAPLPWGRVAEDRRVTEHFQVFLLLAAQADLVCVRDVGATFHSGDRPALLNPDWSGLAVLGEHDIVAYGDSAPAARLAELAQDWVARGAPRLTDWQVEVDGDSPLAIAKRQTRLAFTA